MKKKTSKKRISGIAGSIVLFVSANVFSATIARFLGGITTGELFIGVMVALLVYAVVALGCGVLTESIEEERR